MLSSLAERPPVRRALVAVALAIALAPGRPVESTLPSTVVEAEDGSKDFGQDFVATLAAFDFECVGRKRRCYTLLRIFDVDGDRATQVYRARAAIGAGLYALAGDTFVQRHRRRDGDELRDELYFLVRDGADWKPSAPIAVAPACSVARWESWGGTLTLGANMLVAANHDAACLYERANNSWRHTKTFPLRRDEGAGIELAGDRLLVRYLGYIEVHDRSEGTWERKLIAPPAGHQFWDSVASPRWVVARTRDRTEMGMALHVYDIATGAEVTTLEAPPSAMLPATVAVSDTTLVAAGDRILAWRYIDGAWRAPRELTPSPSTRARLPRRVATGALVWVGEPVAVRPSSRGGTLQGYPVE